MDNLHDMIPNANKIRGDLEENNSYYTIMRQNIEFLNKKIEEAKERGESFTCFIVDSVVKDEIRNMYIEKGYTFKPTGYIDGVWQETEEICW